jgi:hypothetical protein
MTKLTVSHHLAAGLAVLLAAGCNPDDNTPTSAGTTTGVTSVTSAGSTSGTSTTTGESTGTPTTSTTTPPTSTTSETTGTSTGDVTASGSSGDATTGGQCADGTIVCEENTAKVCDGMGGFKSTEECPEACADGLGCVACKPNADQCAGEVSQKCTPDGSMWVDKETCDGLQGVTCDANTGKCAGACSVDSLGTSYIGCDYYPVTLANLHETQPWGFFYAVVVANTTDQMATVTIDRGDMMVTQQMVGPKTAKVIQLPYVDALVKAASDNPGPSLVVADGAYRLRSNQPVTVYQYEPLDYQSGNLYSYTNDASLLLPVNTWTGNYVVASRNMWVFNNGQLFSPGFYAVVAKEDDTKVTLKPSATGGKVYTGGGVKADGTGVVTLNAGDVLEVFSVSAGNMIPNASDLTGTIIAADKPVSVFGGHKCTQIPDGTPACDRLEEAMLPIETLSKEYIVTPPLIPTGGNQPKPQMVRVIATEDATAITYDPPQGAPNMLAKAGDYLELAKSGVDLKITADKKILVVQYMQGQNAGGNSGDPAMALAVATEQYRSDYLIHAPTNYETNYVNITAPMGAMIMLDGAPVANFTAIGNTGFGVARLPLSNNGDGNHTLTGDKPFGVSVYGYGQYTSYWYPGGLDLEILPG